MAAERGEGVRYVALMTAGVNCSSQIRSEGRKGSLNVGSHKSTRSGERYGCVGAVDSTADMVSRVDVYMIYVIKGVSFSCGFLACTKGLRGNGHRAVEFLKRRSQPWT